MKFRTAATALALGIAIATPAVPAAAAHNPHAAVNHGQSSAAHGKTSNKGKHKGHAKGHAKVQAGGTVTAVDATAGTITFTVHGGKDKSLRGTALTVTVAPGAKVTRNGASATLAAVQVGDHVHVSGTKGAGSGAWTVTRVAAEAPAPAPGA